MYQNGQVVVGVDVGGRRKGFHAVALRDNKFVGLKTSIDVPTIVDWCQEKQAVAIGVDSPCQWSLTGRARQAECALMKNGVWCFATPTLKIAENHSTDNYGWMLAGAELFSLLKTHYHLFDGQPIDSKPVCFETFPQAVACALAGKVVSARQKSHVRRKLLKEIGIDTSFLPNIDFVDAALCAVTAYYLLSGKVNAYGNIAEGFIVVPTAT
jgi:predicted nuclease with RNAse H fold